MTTFKVAEQFSRFPGGRYKSDGPGSGEAFRDDFLVPELGRAMAADGILVLVLDGVAGLPTSFLEEAFGGLLRHTEWSLEEIQDVLKLEAADDDLQPYIDLANTYMIAQAARKAEEARRA